MSTKARVFVFADGVVEDYLGAMSFRLYRRSVALVTAMLFALSIAGHGFAVTNMDTNAMAAATDMAMSADDSSTTMDCDGSDMAMKLVCHAFCASAFAIISEPLQLPKRIASHPANSFFMQALQSRGSSPEPHPPRSIALS